MSLELSCIDCAHILAWAKHEGAGFEYDCELSGQTAIDWKHPEHCWEFVNAKTNVWRDAPEPPYQCSIVPEKKTSIFGELMKIPVLMIGIFGLGCIILALWPFMLIGKLKGKK